MHSFVLRSTISVVTNFNNNFSSTKLTIDGVGEVGDRASEGQAAGVYGAGFTAGSVAGK